MNQPSLKALGDELYTALTSQQTIEPLSTRHPDLTIEDAYAIQQHMLARRIAQGERVIGKKIGVTSEAVMNMLGVFQPDFGWLTDGMVYNEGEAIPASSLIQPKAEGEIAFLLKKTLKGPGVTAADVIAATQGVMTCFEIVDSRIRDWKIKIQDTVADNASCGVFVLGDRLVDHDHVEMPDPDGRAVAGERELADASRTVLLDVHLGRPGDRDAHLLHHQETAIAHQRGIESVLDHRARALDDRGQERRHSAEAVAEQRIDRELGRTRARHRLLDPGEQIGRQGPRRRDRRNGGDGRDGGRNRAGGCVMHGVRFLSWTACPRKLLCS